MLGGIRCYYTEIVASGFDCYPDKANHQEYNRNMRLDQVINSGGECGHLFVFEDHQKKSRKCHELPGNQEYNTVLNHTKTNQCSMQ